MKLSAGLLLGQQMEKLSLGQTSLVVVAKHAELLSSACAQSIVYLLGSTELVKLNAVRLNVGFEDLPPVRWDPSDWFLASTS